MKIDTFNNKNRDNCWNDFWTKVMILSRFKLVCNKGSTQQIIVYLLRNQLINKNKTSLPLVVKMENKRRSESIWRGKEEEKEKNRSYKNWLMATGQRIYCLLVRTITLITWKGFWVKINTKLLWKNILYHRWKTKMESLWKIMKLSIPYKNWERFGRGSLNWKFFTEN